VKLKVETEKLNVKTREHPEDVTAWMSLVQLQDSKKLLAIRGHAHNSNHDSA